MKLSDLKESVHDHDHFSLLQKVAAELGFRRLDLHDSSYHFHDNDEEAQKYHYDASADIDTAILIARMPMGDDKDTAWHTLQRLRNLRALDIDDLQAPRSAIQGPLARLRGISQLAQAYQQVEEQQDWVRTGAKNVMSVLMLLNGIKSWAKKEAPRGSEESYKVTVAKTALKKLGIPLEGD